MVGRVDNPLRGVWRHLEREGDGVSHTEPGGHIVGAHGDHGDAFSRLKAGRGEEEGGRRGNPAVQHPVAAVVVCDVVYGVHNTLAARKGREAARGEHQPVGHHIGNTKLRHGAAALVAKPGYAVVHIVAGVGPLGRRLLLYGRLPGLGYIVRFFGHQANAHYRLPDPGLQLHPGISRTRVGVGAVPPVGQAVRVLLRVGELAVLVLHTHPVFAKWLGRVEAGLVTEHIPAVSRGCGGLHHRPRAVGVALQRHPHAQQVVRVRVVPQAVLVGVLKDIPCDIAVVQHQAGVVRGGDRAAAVHNNTSPVADVVVAVQVWVDGQGKRCS